jgi:hypothetical protein
MFFRQWIKRLRPPKHDDSSSPTQPLTCTPYQQLNVRVENYESEPTCYVALTEPTQETAEQMAYTSMNRDELFQAYKLLHQAYVEMLIRDGVRQAPPQEVETDPGLLRIQPPRSWHSVSTDKLRPRLIPERQP